MMTKIEKVSRGGGKTLNFLLSGLMAFGAAATKAAVALAVALFAAMSAQAAIEWTGNNNNLFNNSSNWKSGQYNIVFNNTSASRTLIYLNNNYSGKFKFGSDTTARYRGLYFRAHPANNPWHFCGWDGNAIHSYDNSGGTVGDTGSINVGDQANSTLRLSAITLKTVASQVGSSNYSYTGHVIMDEYDADGTTTRGPVSFETTGNMELYKGDLHATNAVLTCGGDMKLYNFDATLSGGTLNANKIYVGYGSNTSGSLTIEGATVTATAEAAVYVCYGSGATGTLYLNEGGTLVARNIYRQNGTATVVFNGGTLKAKSVYTNYGGLLGNAGSMTITVGEKGGTIDNNSLNIAISGNYMQGSGAVRFTGSGSTTLSVAQQYTGGTTIDAGTLLKVNGAAKTALVAHDVTVAIPAGGVVPDGTVVLETTDGTTFTQAEVDAMAFSGDDDNRYALELADGGAKVKIVDVRAGEYVWNGGASGDSWKTAGAWTKNGTAGNNWYDLVAAVFENAGDEATVDSAVAAESVAFRANATIAGTATLTVPSVVVSNGVSATISAPTAGALEKTGPGTLTLGSARTATTTLSEGTLALSGSGQTTAYANLAFDAENAVTLAIGGGATLTHSGGALYLANDAGQNVTMIIDDGGTVEVRNLFHGYGTGAVVFNGGTLKANQSYSAYGGLIGSGLAVSITGNGGTIDNGGYDILVSKDLDGAMSFTGSGTTTIGVNQSVTGSMTVGGGTVALNAGLTVARSVAVDDGATLKAIGAATLSGVEFADGATLDVTGSDAVAASATFPVNGTVTLKKNGGAFARGLYPILAKTGITAAEVDGKLVPSLASGSSYGYCVKDDTLYLAVDVNMTHSVWTGAAGDGKMSTGGNWWSGTAPGAGDALDLSCITAAATIDCDIDATFGEVTMGSGVVTFTGSLTASSFSDTSKIAVGENSTVTLDGDLDFSNTAEACIVNTVATGGKFVVTGVIRQKSDAGDFSLLPCATAGGGAIVAKGGLSANKPNLFRLGRNGVGTYNWIVGSDGVVSGNSGSYWLYANENEPHTIIKPLDSDFPIAAKIAVREHAILTLVTTGDDGNPHTITLGDGSANCGIYREGTVNITGTGTVVANYNVSDLTDTASQRVNPFVVTDTATLAIKAGKQITTGAINVNSGATLEVPESGTAALTGSLALADGSALAFKVGENENAVLGLQPQTLTLPASGKVTVKLTADSLPTVGTSYTLTDGAGLTDTSKFELADGVQGDLSVSDGGELVYTPPEYFFIRVVEGSSSNLAVPLQWIYDKTTVGGVAEIETALTTNGANGIPVWQSYCLGLEPTNSQSVVLCDAAATQPAGGSVRLTAKNLNVPVGLEGVAVTAYLDRKSSGGWVQQGEPVAVQHGTAIEFTADADPENALSFFV